MFFYLFESETEVDTPYGMLASEVIALPHATLSVCHNFQVNILIQKETAHKKGPFYL